jgi:hypothetical protein
LPHATREYSDMGLFDSILTKIFPHGSTSMGASASEPQVTASATPSAASPASGGGSGAPAMAQVDVEAVLTELAAKSGQRSNWRVSIVDLMTLLGLDSSLTARKQLAAELHYTGDTSDSAAMNIWLHKHVMRKLAENGGKVPDELKA